MSIKKIDGSLMSKCIIHSAAVLRQNKSLVDALNVFPVPDGDTGTNMSLTMDQAVRNLGDLATTSLKEVVEAVAWGSLMGARGNSGVILSQFFRGFAQSASTHKEFLNTADFARALGSGVNSAYRAVMRPVEGTILTVAREISEKMFQESKHIEDMVVVLGNSIKHGEKILEKTPDMLEVLREANVVDAGGKGFLLILSGMLEVLESPEITIDTSKIITEKVIETKATISSEKGLKYTYCTELLISGKSINIELLKADLMPMGDSLMVVGNDELAKVHVHTNNPGKVLEIAVILGELSDIKIDNMKFQHRETLLKHAEKTDQDSANPKDISEEMEIGVVAVSPGEGLSEIFMSMDADIVEGGQSMNPSTESILEAIKRQGAKHTIILPNNKNIILTAKQVSSLGGGKIYTVPSKSVPQGIAALLAYNASHTIENNLHNMTKAISTVITGEVTNAVRNSYYNGENIKEGDVLGIQDGDLLFVNGDEQRVLFKLIDHMTVDKKSGIITIYYGKDVDVQSMPVLNESLIENYPNFDIEYYNGGQSLYQYIVSVE